MGILNHTRHYCAWFFFNGQNLIFPIFCISIFLYYYLYFCDLCDFLLPEILPIVFILMQFYLQLFARNVYNLPSFFKRIFFTWCRIPGWQLFSQQLLKVPFYCFLPLFLLRSEQLVYCSSF